ncbi:hypothetical protein [Streptomyces cylindrosporus]|uniref:Uncharacterized protein n=1 Tax=Streptomyces cylindrosporus TaxID=2927583 RepID=A0ABS9YR44_9ACTN|nr:hypothetical protein [Streptomyces cylindrosporus]MCI3279175.1 hypothetical protein [Streptomyces cylindrosporus]
MSAEPARPSGPDRHPLAPVLILNDRAPRRPSSERTHVPIQPGRPLSDQERLAATMEAVFARSGRSLADEGTATDVLIPLGEVRALLRGAFEKGLIGEEGYRALDDMLKGMEQAPALLA